MAFPLSALLWVLLASPLLAFNLYPGVDQTKLAAALNITTACVQALNETLPECDQTLLQMTASLENYWWTDDNLTALCGNNCSLSVTNWNMDSAAACDEQYFTAYGKLVPIWTVTERYVESLGVACLESWSDDFDWCLTESQEWVGLDILRADCDANPTDPTCAGNVTDIPESSIRMANLYPDEILCNGCFIDMLYTRVTSNYLPDSDHSDYLADQLLDIQDVCNKTRPDFTMRLPTTYDTAPPLTSLNLGSTTTTSSTAAPTTTCAGQAIPAGSLTCDDLSARYGVSTGALQWYTNSDQCTVRSTACLPPPCQLKQVKVGDSCASLAAGVAGNITKVQFQKWNPYVLGLCDSLTEAQYVCVSSPGSNGTFVLPAPPLGTDADAGNQQRGGAGGVVTPTATVTSTVGAGGSATSGVGVPSPTQDGLVANCNNFASAVVGDACYAFATSHGIQPSQLYAWNPVLGANGEECTTALWASEYYCIGTKTQSPVTAPGPTQTGIAANCTKYAQAIAGDGCEAFAKRNGITPAQLYAWNTVLGANGANCGTLLWAQEWYCVAVSG
ncbi:hypothetical protein JX265_001758 [Neoarthrinium moseri]|uniref:LysM domain-containing protein n=1 Tax=Neoarthrinium moseri TaxID=1658444 RepID=A0A9P9WVL8_9PEZI|nr:hypothetical protein JX265_001758 [Neoarthrinium moseri]